MRTRTAVSATSLIAAATLAGGLAPAASAAVATTTRVIVNNPLGHTAGKIVITALVRPTAGTGLPTGTCTFLVDTTVKGTKPVNSKGNCSLTTHTKLGTHTVTVRYGGSTAFAASTGTATIHVIH
jgi:large repetitive protein